MYKLKASYIGIKRINLTRVKDTESLFYIVDLVSFLYNNGKINDRSDSMENINIRLQEKIL